MKKKLLGALIALCGSAAAIGTAFALYTGSLPEDKTIQIGTKTTGDIALVASVKNADSTHEVLSPESQERCITFNAGFTTNESSVYIQDFYYAKLQFKVSSDSTALIAALKEETWVKLGTQVDESEGHPNEYGSYWKNNSLNGTNVEESADHKSLTYTKEFPLFKGSNISEFEFHIRLDTNLSDADYLAIAEETYLVDFEVSEATSDHAYIVGEAVGGWEDRDEFRMTKNAKADHDEWMFKTGTVEGKQQLQDTKDYNLHIGVTYCCGGSNHTWPSANNGKTFYWNGTSGDHGDLFN